MKNWANEQVLVMYYGLNFFFIVNKFDEIKTTLVEIINIINWNHTTPLSKVC